MRHLTFLFFALLTLTFACQNDPAVTVPVDPKQAPDISKPTQAVMEMPAVSYKDAVTFDLTEGTLFWSGKKSGNEMYSVAIPVKSGELLVSNNFILSGKILFDAAALAVQGSMDATEKQKLETALKSASFFNVARYPQIEYAIEGALPSSIPAFNTVLEGKWKVKETANIINLPAQITFTGDAFTFESVSFGLNYSKWNMQMPGDKPIKIQNAQPESADKSVPAPPSGTVMGSDGITLMLNCKGKKRSEPQK
jgi:hypothetical protein